MRIGHARQPQAAWRSDRLWIFRWLAVLFFYIPCAVRVNITKSAVEKNCLYFDTEYLFMLKTLTYAVRDTVLAPAVPAAVHAMPATEFLWQATPLTSMPRALYTIAFTPGGW